MSEERVKLLAQQVADGDHDAFDALFGLYYGRVENFIRSLLRKESVTQDLAQDVFVHLWHARAHLRNVQSPHAYIYTITRNIVIDHLRRTQYVRFTTAEIPDTPSDKLTDETYFALEKELLIRMAVETFPERRRQIFTMSRFEGLSHAEIAERLGISRKTVENQINLALHDLKKTVLALSAFFLLSS